jgi:hypothetical protein
LHRSDKQPASAQETSYTYYFDGDGDGYGKSNSPLTSDDPIPPPGYTSQSGDCNDGDPSAHPGATEICGDGIDNNCDGQIDEGCPALYTLILMEMVMDRPVLQHKFLVDEGIPVM